MSTLSNMVQLDNARICLNALLVTDAFGGRKHMTDVVLKHYYWGLLKQLHTLLGSFDVIGETTPDRQAGGSGGSSAG